MGSTTKPDKETNRMSSSNQKLMVSAFICLERHCALSTEVSRGMIILSKEGHEAGKVAAVMIDRESRMATHILLSRLPQTAGYWMVPVNEITDVNEDNIQTNIADEVVDSLPLWHPGE